MLRLLIASANVIEGVLSVGLVGSVVYTVVSTGWTTALAMLMIYGSALVFLHAASAFYALS